MPKRTTTPMIDAQGLIRLQTWLSPAFPTGAFSYSHGLEQAIARGLIADQEDLNQWLVALVNRGAGWNDAVILAECWRLSKDDKPLVEIAELAIALSLSKERHLETTAQGNAFIQAASAWGRLPHVPNDCPLPVGVGVVSAQHGIDVSAVIAAYLHAYVSNQVQAALRLMKLGQQGGVEILVALEVEIMKVAGKAAASTLDDLGSAAFMADICAMQHEHLETRIFRS